MSAAFDGLKAEQGPYEALIYNLWARPFPPTPVAEVTPERLESDWKTGDIGALLCVQQVLPCMQASGKGSIIFTGASASLRGSARFGSFAVAKTGLRSLAACQGGGQGAHVSHADAPKGRMLDTAAAADFYWMLHTQEKRCFAFEADLWPLFEAAGGAVVKCVPCHRAIA